jgi:hypothetical protein
MHGHSASNGIKSCLATLTKPRIRRTWFSESQDFEFVEKRVLVVFSRNEICVYVIATIYDVC